MPNQPKRLIPCRAMLIAGKVAVMAAVGQAFGLTLVQSLRRCVCVPWFPSADIRGMVLGCGLRACHAMPCHAMM